MDHLPAERRTRLELFADRQKIDLRRRVIVAPAHGPTKQRIDAGILATGLACTCGDARDAWHADLSCLRAGVSHALVQGETLRIVFAIAFCVFDRRVKGRFVRSRASGRITGRAERDRRTVRALEIRTVIELQEGLSIDHRDI